MSDSLLLDTDVVSYLFKNSPRAKPFRPLLKGKRPALAFVSVAELFKWTLKRGWGPRPDVDEFRPLIVEARRWMRLARVNADAGYDSEANDRFARQRCHIRTIIPAKIGRPTAKPAAGRYRRLMQVRFDWDVYHDRCQVETVMSMLKRRQGCHAHGHTYRSQCRDLYLMALTHNAMIFVIIELFYRADLSPFHAPFGPLSGVVRWGW